MDKRLVKVAMKRAARDEDAEMVTARTVIAAARREVEAQYLAVCAEIDDVHAAAPRMAVA